MHRAVADVMTEAVIHVDPTSPLTRVLELMVNLKARSFPAPDHNRQLQGIISQRTSCALSRKRHGKRSVNKHCACASMITLEDCIGLCGLTEEEVVAIAEHEHLPEIAAAAMAQYLLAQEHGSEKVREMIVDDIRQAQRVGRDKEHVLTPLHVLHHFLKTHPGARPSHHPWSKRL